MDQSSIAVNLRIFLMWFGGDDVPATRQASVDDFREMGLDVVVLRDRDVDDWEVPAAPLPPAFRLLSPIQRSDYMRAYLMHHHGGSYADLKRPGGSWIPALTRLAEDPDLWAVGYPIPRWAISSCGVEVLPRYQPQRLGWWRYRWLQLNHKRILGGGGYSFKPYTELTRRWMDGVNARLAEKAPLLELHPGRYAKERNGDINDGVVSQYPVPWLYLAGDVLHPLAYKYRRHVATIMPPLELVDYQDDRPNLSSGPRDSSRTWPDA